MNLRSLSLSRTAGAPNWLVYRQKPKRHSKNTVVSLCTAGTTRARAVTRRANLLSTGSSSLHASLQFGSAHISTWRLAPTTGVSSSHGSSLIFLQVSADKFCFFQTLRAQNNCCWEGLQFCMQSGKMASVSGRPHAALLVRSQSFRQPLTGRVVPTARSACRQRCTMPGKLRLRAVAANGALSQKLRF